MSIPGKLRVTSSGYLANGVGGYVPLITPFTVDAHRDKGRGASPEARANAEEIAKHYNGYTELISAAQRLDSDLDLLTRGMGDQGERIYRSEAMIALRKLVSAFLA